METLFARPTAPDRCPGGCSIIMCDVDNFKAYNDTGGHLAGDEALKKIAAAMKHALRSQDLMFRYGGEEIVVLLPGTDVTTAAGVAERLCRAVKDLAIPHLTAPEGVLTISAGVSGCTGNNRKCHGHDRILREADDAMYRAKSRGKNRVETAA
jgi:diguanylate cyclase (GGDEF)-like protein